MDRSTRGSWAHRAPRRRWHWARWEAVVGLVVGVVAIVPMANLNNPSFPFDDGYISFAYAARLATGHGLRLTVGSTPVEAFSDPLWVFLMALGKAVGVPIPTWSRVIEMVSIAALAATTAGLVRRLNQRAPLWMAAAAAALVGLLPATVFSALGGLEILLFAGLLNGVLLALLADRSSKRSPSGVTTGLCFLLFLTRVECLAE